MDREDTDADAAPRHRRRRRRWAHHHPRRRAPAWPGRHARERGVRAVKLRGAAVLIVLLLAGAASAQMSRDAALQALGQAEPEARRRAVTALAAIGTFDDVPRLVAALRDTDPLVRRLTERALWQVWSRSGDRDIDRLFAVGVEQVNDQQGPAAVPTFSEIIRRKPDLPA